MIYKELSGKRVIIEKNWRLHSENDCWDNVFFKC